MSAPIQTRAKSWLSSQIMATEACIERLAGVQNDAVNQDSQASQIARLRADVAVWKYLAALVGGL